MHMRENIVGDRGRAGALRLTLAFCIAVSVPASARALGGTDAQREACTPDAFRLCSAEIPDANRVAACMQANIANLSPACRAVFQPAQPAAAPPRRPRAGESPYERRRHYSKEREVRHHKWLRRHKWADE